MLTEGFFDFKKQAGEGLCWVKGCQRASKKDLSLCHMHEMRRWRAKKKRIAAYCTLRDHARARGIVFTITPDYWRGVVDAFGYFEPGEGEVMSVDRVDPTKGYEEGNIRVVSVSVNSFKSQRERYLPEHIQHMLDRRRDKLQSKNAEYLALDPDEPQTWDELDFKETETDDDCPF